MFPTFISRANPNAFRTFNDDAVTDWTKRYPNLNGNPFFDYGTLRWKQSGSHTSDLTDNHDGTVHIKALSNYGGISPEIENYPRGDYVIGYKCDNVISSGKLAWYDGSNWHNEPVFNSDIDTTVLAIDTKVELLTINANNNTTFECDIDHFFIQRFDKKQIPDMTSQTTPYGVCSESVVMSPYFAWKAFDRSRSSSYDAWITPTLNGYTGSGEWLQWIYDAIDDVAPARVEVYPRGGMGTSWYANNNPKVMEFYVIKPDNSAVLVHSVDVGIWDNNVKKIYNLNTNEAGKGFRLKVVETQSSVATGTFHTAIGMLNVWGHIV